MAAAFDVILGLFQCFSDYPVMSARPAHKTILLAAAVIIVLAAILFWTSPKAEDFWWTDAPSFALNGELIRDYLLSGFHQAPMAFAKDWFRYYPALNFSLYPPLFPVVEAAAFSLFGFSHVVAQGVVTGFVALAAFGIYYVIRTALDGTRAIAGIMLLFATPVILLWSRQVVLELPALAFLLVSAALFLQFQARRRTRDLMLATTLLLAAVYTKQTAIFMAPAVAVAFVVSDGWRLSDRRVWIAAAVGIVGLLPLAIFTLFVAREGLEIATGVGIGAGSRPTQGFAGIIEQTTAYFYCLPAIIGWPVLAASGGYLALLLRNGWVSLQEKRLTVLMGLWFACDFIFVSLVAHFEERYALALAVPCAVFATLLLARMAGGTGRQWIVPGVGLAFLVVALSTQTVPRISGYDQVAAFILDHSKKGDVIWFQAEQSKNLAFSLRSHLREPKVVMLRAEKYLVDYHIARANGISDRGWSAADLEKLVDREGISMIVLDQDFWSDLPSMARMQDYVRSDRFTQVAEFRIASDEPRHRVVIKIFVNKRPTAPVDKPTG